MNESLNMIIEKQWIFDSLESRRDLHVEQVFYDEFFVRCRIKNICCRKDLEKIENDLSSN